MSRKLVLFLLLGISLNLVEPLAVLGQSYCINQPSVGQKLYLEPGDLVEFKLESNPSTGFSWTKTSEEDEAVLVQENHWLEEKAAIPGAPGTEHWVFKAVGAGKNQLELWYARPWESSMPGKKLIMEVNVSTGDISQYPGSVWINSQEVQFSEKPVAIGGRVMVEMEQLAAALGTPVQTDGTKVRLSRGERVIMIDSKEGTIGIDGSFEQLPVYQNGEKIMVPIRVIAESLGYSVDWRASDQAIVINSKDQ